MDSPSSLPDGPTAPCRGEATAFDALAQASIDAVLVTTPEGRILAANDAACTVFRCSRAELLAARCGRFIDEADPRLLAALAGHQHGAPAPTELTFLRAGGEPFPARVSVSAFQSATGESRCVLVIRDRSHQVRQQQALAESELRFRSLSEQAPIGIFIAQDDRFSYVNPALARLFGYQVDELVGTGLPAIIHPDDAPRMLERCRRGLAGEAREPPAGFRGRRKDGSLIDAELHAAVLTVQGRPAVFGNILDVTERHAAERTLRDQERRYRTLFELESDAILLADVASNRVLDANESAVALYGYSRDELLSRRIVELSAEHEEGIRIPGEKPFSVNRVVRIPPRQHRRKDSTTFIAEVTIRFLRLHGAPLALLAVRDVTEARRAENALRESQAVLKAIADSTTDLIWSVDAARFGLLTFNEALRRYFANERRVAIQPGMRPEDLFAPPASAAQWRGFYERAVSEGAYRVEYEAFARATVIELNFSPLMRDREVFGVSVFGRDITERKRSEQKIAQYHARLHRLAERLQGAREEESLRIARVVHDELGQHLTALKMDLRGVESGLERLADPNAGALLDQAVSATALLDETVTIVQRIAAEVRPPILDKLGLFAALRHETEQFQHRSGIACRLVAPEPSPRLPSKLAIASYRIVQEALTNVARHAAATEVTVEFRVQPDAFLIEIRDNGTGISPDALNNVQSLGLLGMQERARPFRGEVAFERASQGGTIVRATFPVSDAPKAPP